MKKPVQKNIIPKFNIDEVKATWGESLIKLLLDNFKTANDHRYKNVVISMSDALMSATQVA
ncbi:MAG: hypothetical protein HQK49_16380 [Oligoflexia bacterium]|nr:hypothetical protein [Oligoflexia bacterium]